MRIGIDARMYKKDGTGISRYIKELIYRAPKKDLDNTYILFVRSEMVDDIPKLPNIETQTTTAGYYSWQEQVVFLFALYKARLDIVHFTNFNAPILYIKKSIVTIHDVTLMHFPGNKMSAWYFRLAYYMTLYFSVKKAKKVITVSNNTQKDLKKMFALRSDTMITTYLGVESFYSKTQINKTFLQKKQLAKKFLLYVGVWRSHKNIVRLIHSFDALKKQGYDIQLALTGKSSPYYPEIDQAIDKSPYKKDIIRLGYVSDEDLRCLYAKAHALVNPSLYEGFGVPPLEAMACQTLSIVSCISSHPEVCSNYALFFDPYVVEDMVRVIKSSFDDDQMRQKYIQKASKYVKKFRFDDMVGKTIFVYNSL